MPCSTAASLRCLACFLLCSTLCSPACPALTPDPSSPAHRTTPWLQPGTQIVVHGLPYRTSWQDLKDMCKWVAPAHC